METRYFYTTINFQPNYDNQFELIKSDIYSNSENGKLYRKRLLYDFGWGREYGYAIVPEPSFRELISMIEYVSDSIRNNPFYFFSKKKRALNKQCWDNAYGAIAVIMEEYVDELILFLQEKVQTDYFDDAYIRQRFQHFAFDRKKAHKFGICAGATINNQHYESVFNENKLWKKISSQVIKQVYK